jgi:hypothetical protein
LPSTLREVPEPRVPEQSICFSDLGE